MSAIIEQPTKDELLRLLTAFANQRPRLDFANYGDVSSYRSEARSITADLHDFNALAAACGWRSVNIAEQLSNRLTLFVDGRGHWQLDYCTGQYWPTEYRKAACRVLANALWDYWRNESTGESIGKTIRYKARREFGRRIANRYFN